jgi:hypothetical protein
MDMYVLLEYVSMWCIGVSCMGVEPRSGVCLEFCFSL